ncbi:MAG: ribonuclease HII [Lachnospiraceae bacterium]|nr:ribonuclease HII [Lachnospiraceae bacterium]MCR4801900.1 ribonuclease HII [Lachnospiraceae bacterium]
MAETIAAIKKKFETAELVQRQALFEVYEQDERQGVQSIIKKYKKIQENYEQEIERTEKMKEFEYKYSDYSYICGIDEVGRGPLAGPVVACAVILPKDETILYLNDSKQLSAAKREELYKVIMEKAVGVGIGVVSPETIDEINILQATYEAMRIAISKLPVKPDLLLNDAVTIPGVDIKQVGIVKGDARSVSIAAASIVAKVTRDQMMVEYDKIYPEYHFASNKGYGSKVHTDALKEIGPCPIHRRTFIKNFGVSV